MGSLNMVIGFATMGLDGIGFPLFGKNNAGTELGTSSATHEPPQKTELTPHPSQQSKPVMVTYDSLYFSLYIALLRHVF